MVIGDTRGPGDALGSAEANRRFYESQAAIYDETEFCAIDDVPREALRGALRRAIALLGDSPKTLDAGGGTGNASLALRELGVTSVLIDASPEMISRWEQKARAQGFESNAELADIEAFFHQDERRWDLIVFSSVLHHLEDPAAVLIAARDRLNPGGVIVTMFDPMAVDRFGHFLRRLDYGCWIALHSPVTLARAVKRRLTAIVRPQPPEANIGAMAERHAMSGLDDEQIKARLSAAGIVVVEHERFYDARFKWIVNLSRRLKQHTHFALTLQRPS